MSSLPRRRPRRDAVWCCVRPAHLGLAGEDANGDRDGVAGHVTARSFEGDGYALTVEPDGTDEALEAWLPSSRTGSTPAVGERVSVRIPPGAIHLLAR